MSSGYHCMSGIYNIGHCVMPCGFQTVSRGQVLVFYIDTAPECIL